MATSPARLLPILDEPCCPSGLSTPLDRPTADRLARLLKAVADPARLQLLALHQVEPERRVLRVRPDASRSPCRSPPSATTCAS